MLLLFYKMIKRAKILLLIFLLPIFALGQKFEYGLEMDGIGDNREFFSGYSEPGTTLGSRIGIDAGTRIDSIHQIRAGVSYFYEYGSVIFEQPIIPILYYSVEKGPLAFKMGAFMRKEAIQFPQAIISDMYEYYNPTIDGLLFKYKKTNWQSTVFVDWVSRTDSVRREQFMAGIQASVHPGNFIADFYWYMFHNAGNLSRPAGDHIKDYMGALATVGYDFSKFIPKATLTVKTGVLVSMFRDRGTNGLDYQPAFSSYTEVEAAYKGFGVKSLFNFGDKHSFSHGDVFFNNTTSYIRTDLYFTPINLEHVKGRFTWSFHWANSDMENQQLFSLVYIFKKL